MASPSILRPINGISARELRLAVVVTMAVALLDAVWVAYHQGAVDARLACGYPCVGSGHIDFSLTSLRLQIAAGIGIAALALSTKKILGLIVSIFALAFVGIKYASWYVDSKRWLKEVGLPDFSTAPTEIAHLGGLHGATRLDLILLALITLLLVWEILLFIRTFKVLIRRS